MITSQFCCNGSAKQADIVKAFGVTKQSVLRAVKLFREKGSAGFFEVRRTRGPVVLTPQVLAQAQALLDDELEVPDVAKELNVKPNTLWKAVRAKRLHVVKKKAALV
jgi:transposase-like protein